MVYTEQDYDEEITKDHMKSIDEHNELMSDFKRRAKFAADRALSATTIGDWSIFESLPENK